MCEFAYQNLYLLTGDWPATGKPFGCHPQNMKLAMLRPDITFDTVEVASQWIRHGSSVLNLMQLKTLVSEQINQPIQLTITSSGL